MCELTKETPLFLLQLVWFAGNFALEDIEQKVFSRDDAVGTKNGFDGLAGEFRVIIFLAQVAKPDVLQAGRDIFGQCLPAIDVAQVAVGALDALAQVFRIGTTGKHLRIVVGFKDEIVALSNERVHLVCDMTAVGDDGQHDAVVFYLIANAVRAVVRYGKGGYAERSYLNGLIFCQVALLFKRNLLADAPVLVDSHVDLAGRIDGHPILLRQSAHAFDVVGMVVRNKNMVNAVQLKPIVVEVLLERARANSCIDEECVLAGAEIIAIAATSTTKGDKLQHVRQ